MPMPAYNRWPSVDEREICRPLSQGSKAKKGKTKGSGERNYERAALERVQPLFAGHYFLSSGISRKQTGLAVAAVR